MTDIIARDRPAGVTGWSWSASEAIRRTHRRRTRGRFDGRGRTLVSNRAVALPLNSMVAQHEVVTLGDDHGDLPRHADRLVRRVETLRSLFVLGRVEHHQHLQFSERSRLLADHLRAALLLAGAGRYPSAFVTLRTALEHHLMDRLLFLGNRWIIDWGVKKSAVEAEDVRLRELKAGTRPDIERWWHDPRTGKMKVVIRGIFREGSRGHGVTLSRYYFVLDEYDPFTGNPNDLGRLVDPFMDGETRWAWAERSRREWYDLFAYDKLIANLEVNRLLSSRQRLQVDVHYRALSAFVHATNQAYDLAYGPDIPSRIGSTDHYASELVLLYVITLAAEELGIFARAARRTPRLVLAWTDVETEIFEARQATAYFWFLAGEPTAYDRIQEVHTRFDRRHLGRNRRVDPARIPSSRIRYYVNPLKRLVGLHGSFQELTTGLAYHSPFERTDSRRRK